MKFESELKEAQNRWKRECVSSDVGLWWIADDIRDMLPGLTEDEVRETAINALRPLLETRSIRAVRLLTGGGFEEWEGDVESQLALIDAQWKALGRAPDIGDVVWFIGKRDFYAEYAGKHMAEAGHYVPWHTLEEAIQHGKRVADPQGAQGAVKIIQEIMINRMPRTLEIIYREADNTILHFLYK